MKIDVATVGHVLMDLRFTVDRLARPDEEAEIEVESRGVGGSAANVAVGVRRLGGSSAVVGKVGFDSFGRHAMDELMRERVDVSGVRIGMGPTGFTVIIIDSSGSISMYGFRGVADELEEDEVDERIIGDSKIIHIASLRQDTSLAVAERAKRGGSLISWDPGRLLSRKGLGELSHLVSTVDIVLLSELECRAMTGKEDFRAGARAISALGPKTIVVKRGSKGAYILHESSEFEIPAFKLPRVVDTTGAGDAFAAGLLLSLSRGYGMKKSLVYASAAAALKVTKLGSHEVPSHEEVVKLAWEELSQC